MNNKFNWKNVRFLPILHNRMEFAIEVNRQFKEFKPDCVALEYPNTLKDKIIQGIKRLPLLSIVYYHEDDDTPVYLPIEPADGMVEAARLALEDNIPLHFIDRDEDGYEEDISSMPDSYSITVVGYHKYCESYLKVHPKGLSDTKDILREKTMAFHLQQLSESGQRILFICGLMHLPGILEKIEHPQAQVIGRRKRLHINIAHVHQDSSREIMSEMPYLSAEFELFRSGGINEVPDRLLVNSKLIREARGNHWKNSKEKISDTQLRILNKFARNYSFLTGRLVPDFYQLIIAARGAVDDNFAYEVWDKGSEYPWQTEEPGMPVLNIDAYDLFQNQKNINFHRKSKTLRRRLISVPVRNRKREPVPGEWRKELDVASICSYPPEDIAIEGYGKYLQKKAMEIKTRGSSRVEPFICSMLDGIDLRETIRDWANGKIYVKENAPFNGKVGSVVVIFDADYVIDGRKENFPWKVTWLGEHNQESDMAFYSTPAGEVMSGPGISKCQYGGFMLSYPPMRVYDIWEDPFFDMARDKPERLLMAALDYSIEQHVVYVDANPPSGWCLSMAARLGKKIIYLPIGSFSPVTLKKIRQFHVLNGHHVRKYAHSYIN